MTTTVGLEEQKKICPKKCGLKTSSSALESRFSGFKGIYI